MLKILFFVLEKNYKVNFHYKIVIKLNIIEFLLRTSEKTNTNQKKSFLTITTARLLSLHKNTLQIHFFMVRLLNLK